MSFWSEGFWASNFWSADFWEVTPSGESAISPLAIAVQGVGFGAALLALQGIGTIDVPTPPIPEPLPIVEYISHNVTTRDWVKVNREDILKIPATVSLPTIVARALVEDVNATGAAKASLSSTYVQTQVKSATGSGQGHGKIAMSRSAGSLSAVAAYGQHDIEDEDILAAILTLLDL